MDSGQTGPSGRVVPRVVVPQPYVVVVDTAVTRRPGLGVWSVSGLTRRRNIVGGIHPVLVSNNKLEIDIKFCRSLIDVKIKLHVMSIMGSFAPPSFAYSSD